MLIIIGMIFAIAIIFNIVDLFSKRHIFFNSIILLSLMLILFYGNFLNPDYNGYLSVYNNINAYKNINGNLEKGYIILIKLFNNIGLNYNQFLGVLAFFSFYIMYKIVKKYTNNLSLVFLLYLIHPFFYDIIQIRNFIASIFLLKGIDYLVSNKKRGFIIFNYLGTLFHRLANIYFVLLLSLKGGRVKQICKYLVRTSLSIFFIILFSGKNIPYLNEILNFIDIPKLNKYLLTKTNYGFLISVTRDTLVFFVVYYSRKLYLRNTENIKGSLKKIREINFINITYKIWYINFIIFPLHLINSNFSRISRNYLILVYIVLGITLDSIKDFKTKTIYILLIILLMGTLFFFHYIVIKNFNIIDFFKYNILWGN